MGGGLSRARLDRLQETMEAHVAAGSPPGLVWVLARRGEVHAGTAGVRTAGTGAPIGRDALFRISSMTKPVTAVAALLLVEDCRLRLDDPVDRWLPELADRRVLARPEGPLEDTVPAARPITVGDVLTFRLGLGMDFAATEQPVLEAMAPLGIGAGLPAPATHPEPDEWMRRLGTLPLAHQPGARWLYHTGSDVLGVLVARAAGQPLDRFLEERVFDPLGMGDTRFSVPPAAQDRFGACHWVDPATGDPGVYDPADGQWSTPPAFPAGGDGLVSTADDFLAFAELLLGRGTRRGRRLLSRPTVEAMTTNQLTDDQVMSSFDPTGATGWGYGVGVQLRRTGPPRSVGTYGWEGGLGTTWANDPAEDLVGILLTNQTWASPTPPPVRDDFWTCAYAAIDD